MLKKVAVLAGAASLLLAVAAPALARGHQSHNSGGSNVAIVDNNVSASANTGYVLQGNGVSAFGVKGSVYGGDNTAVTGDAYAEANGVVVANTTIGGHSSVKNMAIVDNTVVAGANTGEIVQGNEVNAFGGWHRHGSSTVNGGTNTAVTGDAGAVSNGWVVVNTSWSH